jgi:hypothetical protein
MRTHFFPLCFFVAFVVYKSFMKTTFTFLLFILLFCNPTFAQDYRFHLGLDANPLALLSGNVELVGLLQLPKRISVKPSVGLTYNVDNRFRALCLVDHNYENTITKGTCAKLAVDFKFVDKKSYKLYAGGSLLYSSFEKSGMVRTGPVEKLQGQIFTGGFNLGARKKFFNLVVFDLGGQLFIYDREAFNIGPSCINFIPGYSREWYFHAMFDLKKRKE